MSRSQLLVVFAVLGIATSAARAFPPCSRRACSDELGTSDLTRAQRRACRRQIRADCLAGACSCTGGSPACRCSICGDGLCGPSEDCSTCPQDCGQSGITTVTTVTTTY